MRKSVTIFIALCLLAGGCASSNQASRASAGEATSATKASDPVEKAALDMGERVLASSFELYPEITTRLRPPGATYDKLEDPSFEAVRKRHVQYDAWLMEIGRIDRNALHGGALAAYDTAREVIEEDVGTRPCHDEVIDGASSEWGWPVRFGFYAETQPVGTDALREQAIKRFGAMPAHIDTQIANLREGIRLGYVVHEATVRAALEQVDGLLALPAEHSPLLDLADRDGTPAFRARMVTIVSEGILPAARRYRDFLSREYLAHARHKPGLSDTPDGNVCYRALLRANTTLDIDPREIHAIGWKELAKVEAQMQEISAKSFGNEPVRALLDRFRNDPAYRYHDKNEMMVQANAAIDRARAAIPKVFGLLPREKVIVQPIPEFLEKSSSAHYNAAPLDGSRPATYHIRLYRPDQQSRTLAESIAFHETIPGHHLQLDIQEHLGNLPPIARYLGNSGYSEGWGLYAEQLADELGLYSSDADRIGMLSMRAFRAVRLIVDTGIHALGWDRQRAIDTMLAHTATSPDFAAAQIDRYISSPGQACSYMLGYLEIMSLRDEAKRTLGPRFDLRAFHDRVLENGAVPLPVLRKNIRSWLAAGGK